MKLIPVDCDNEQHLKVLYDLLAERTPDQSISHKKMPTWQEHKRFVEYMVPIGHCVAAGELGYDQWFLIEVGDEFVGGVYLTDMSEIGVSVFKAHQGRGHGLWAVMMLMHMQGPQRYLANINPANEPSRKMFEKLGFKTIQHTLSLEAE